MQQEREEAIVVDVVHAPKDYKEKTQGYAIACALTAAYWGKFMRRINA